MEISFSPTFIASRSLYEALKLSDLQLTCTATLSDKHFKGEESVYMNKKVCIRETFLIDKILTFSLYIF